MQVCVCFPSTPEVKVASASKALTFAFFFFFQAGQQRWWEQEITVNGNIQKGELITYNLTELIKPEAYEVRLTPITRFGEGDSTIRVIKYSGKTFKYKKMYCGTFCKVGSAVWVMVILCCMM